jgi:hypothetical protein
MRELQILLNVLKQPDKFNWTHSLFICGKIPYVANSNCAVLNEDELESSTDISGFISENGLKYALGIQQLQDVVKNLKNQEPNPTDAELVKAFNFYLQNDAYLPL